jgi:hypothetical protein
MDLDWVKFLKVALVSHEPIAMVALAWMVAFVLYAVGQIWFGCAWTGRWRVVALLPLIGPVLGTIGLFYGMAYSPEKWGAFPDSPWGFLQEPIVAAFIWAPVGLVYFVVAGIARLARKKAAVA